MSDRPSCSAWSSAERRRRQSTASSTTAPLDPDTFLRDAISETFDFDDAAAASSDDDNVEDELDFYATEIEKIDFGDSVDWSCPTSCSEAQHFFSLCLSVSELLSEEEYEDDTVVPDELEDSYNDRKAKSVQRIYEAIVNTLMLYVVPLSRSRPNSINRYASSGLTRAYQVAALCLSWLEERGVLSLSFAHLYPETIEYCAQNTLVVTARRRICDYDFVELFSALNTLDAQWCVLEGCADLLHYVAALESRAATLISNTWGACVARLEQYREQIINKDDNDEYMISNRGIYRLALQFLCMRRDLNGLHLDKRNIPPFRPSADQRDQLLSSLIEQAANLQTDELPDALRPAFRMMQVSSFRAREFFAKNPSVGEVQADLVVEKTRGKAYWTEVCELAAMPYDRIIRFADDSLDSEGNRIVADQPLLFRAAFLLLFKLILSKDVQLDVNKFMVSGGDFSRGGEHFWNELRVRSESVPLFGFLMNDLCIVFQSRIFAFGVSSERYVDALWCWLKILHSKHCRDHISPTVLATPLYRTLLGKDGWNSFDRHGKFSKSVAESSRTSTGAVVKTVRLSKNARRKLRRARIHQQSANDSQVEDFQSGRASDFSKMM